MRYIYYSEDDYCQLEILPVQNYEHCKKEMDGILDLSEDSQVEEGVGWTDIYVRDTNPVPLIELNIPVKELCSSLEEVACRFDNVHTGYGNDHRVISQNTIAYGDSDDVVIFFDHEEKGNAVENIWLALYVCNEAQRESAQKILSNISKFGDLMLVDWGWNLLMELNNATEVGLYLDRRMKCFGDDEDVCVI